MSYLSVMLDREELAWVYYLYKNGGYSKYWIIEWW